MINTSNRAQSSTSIRTPRRPSTTISTRPTSSQRASTPTLSRPNSNSGQSRQRPKIPLPSEPDPDPDSEYQHHMAEPASPTPTRRRGPRRAVRTPQTRSATQRLGEDDSEDIDLGDGELSGLLGVIEAPRELVSAEKTEGRKGVLAISKADIEASGSNGSRVTSTPRNRRPTTGGNGRTTPARQGQAQRQIPAEGQTQSESDTPASDSLSRTTTPRARQPRTRSSTKPQPQPAGQANVVSGLSAQLAAHATPSKATPISNNIGITPSTSSGSAYDVSSLSRSLPSEALFAPSASAHAVDKARIGVGIPGSSKTGKGRRKKGVESEDESKLWDAPADAGPSVAQDMTWQQQLGSYPYADGSSRKSTPVDSIPTNGGKQKKSSRQPAPSPLNPSASTSVLSPNTRPTHSRRSSADALPSHARHQSFPLQPSSRPVKANHPPSAYPLSTFDTLPPFNPALNVHRAPQTPAKGGLAKKYAVMELPLLKGGFPRMNSGELLNGSNGQLGNSAGSGGGGPGGPGAGMGQGGNYAGASFHNSPHGRALPKPDMEDF